MKKIIKCVTLLAVFFILGISPLKKVGDIIVVPDVQAAKISKKSITLVKGTTFSLKIKGSKKAVIWKSNKPAIAAVDSRGTVTAIGKGKTTVIAQIGKKKLKCKVKVINAKLSSSEVSLGVKQTLSLKVTGAKVKKWKTSNKNIAVVNKKGKVTGKRAGTAVITAQVGNSILKCTVTVFSPQDEQQQSESESRASDSTPEQTKEAAEPGYNDLLSAPATIVNNGYVSIKVTKINKEDDNYYVHCSIKNKLSTLINISCIGWSIDGCSLVCGEGADIMSEKTLNTSFTIYSSYLENYNISSMHSIQAHFQVFEDGQTVDSFKSDVIVTKNGPKYDSTINVNKYKEIYSSGAIRAYYMGYGSFEDRLFGPRLLFYNGTDESLFVGIKDIAFDGIMDTAALVYDIYPHTFVIYENYDYAVRSPKEISMILFGAPLEGENSGISLFESDEITINP